MNFKRFNGSTWDAIHHKTYDTLTESLTAFPAQIQASGDPLTDFTIYGNTLQNGTPSPSLPVDVVGCGDWDATAQQYNLPITVNGTECPIYLGQVETTRRIKRLVLTGTESFYSWDNGLIYITISDGNKTEGMVTSCCTHFVAKDNRRYASTLQVNECAFRSQYTQYAIKTVSGQYADIDAFKTWLQQQYAAGTPVTLWYVLATPETGIANEPLHKIGDYADAITMAQADVTIPTSDGDNIITFGTSVQPSAMSATFKGWHPVQGAKQYDGSEWR